MTDTPQIPEYVQKLVDEENYTDPCYVADDGTGGGVGKWWAFPPLAVMAVPIEKPWVQAPKPPLGQNPFAPGGRLFRSDNLHGQSLRYDILDELPSEMTDAQWRMLAETDPYLRSAMEVRRRQEEERMQRRRRETELLGGFTPTLPTKAIQMLAHLSRQGRSGEDLFTEQIHDYEIPLLNEMGLVVIRGRLERGSPREIAITEDGEKLSCVYQTLEHCIEVFLSGRDFAEMAYLPERRRMPLLIDPSTPIDYAEWRECRLGARLNRVGNSWMILAVDRVIAVSHTFRRDR
jgi:hypothetical protein